MQPRYLVSASQLVCLAIALGACSSELGNSKTCYSPTQNAETALGKDAQGCACSNSRDMDTCVQTEARGSVAFFCDGERWQSGFDGPCTPVTKWCYSPTEHLDRAYQDGAIGCPCGEGDAAQCVEGVALVCEGGQWQAVEDGPCAPPPPPPPPPPPSCGPGYLFDAASKACAPIKYTVEACKTAGGLALADPGDGSIVSKGCPRSMKTLGFIDAGWDEGGRCCQQTATSCAPQRAQWQGACPGAQFFYWNGGGCKSQAGCSCEGADCSVRFISEADCLAAFAGCPTPRACGARAGNTCSASEYCAYRPEGICGQADAQSVCAPRPTACAAVAAPVCGCDGNTYSNECLANLAGTGLYAFGACK